MLRGERDEALEQLTATSEVLKIVSVSPDDLERVFQSILENTTRICGAKFGTLYLSEEDGFYAAAFHNAPPAFVEARKSRLLRPDPESTLSRVARTKQAAQVVDSRKREAYRKGDSFVVAGADLGGYRTIMSVPMLNRDRLIGVISIYRQEVRPFTDKQIELVQNFAAQAVIAIENTRLLNELRQRTDDLSEALEQQTATSEVLKVISSSPGELQPVFQTMLENAVQICGAKFGMLYLSNGDGFRTIAMHDVPRAFAEKRGREPLVFPPAGSPLGRVVRTKQVAHIDDVRTEADYNKSQPFIDLAELGGARTVVAVPMLKDDELVGAIVIYRQEVRAFSDKQIALLSNFTDQAVIAIENVRLLNELRESLQQQTATADVLKVISRSTFDLQTVLDTLVESVTRLCDAKDAFIFLRKGELYHVAARYGFSHAFHEFLFQNPRPADRGSITGRTALEAKVVHVSDVMADPEYNWSQAQQLGDYRTVLGVPLLRNGVPIGVIIVGRTYVQPFTDKQIELVTTFADQAVIAIENTRLFDAEQQRTRELSESLEQQTATADVLKVISSTPGELEPVFQAILENAVRICEAKFGILFRCDGSEFNAAAWRGVPPEYDKFLMERGAFQPLPGAPLYRLIETKELVQTADELAEPNPGPAAKVGGARSLIAVPMRKENELVGAFVIYRTEVRPFNEKQIELVQNFAAQAVIAIENARLLNELRQRTDDLTEALEQQTAIAEVLGVISSSPGDLAPVFDTILANATRLCEGNLAALWRYDGKVLVGAAQYNASPAFAERYMGVELEPGREGPVRLAALERRTVHVADITTEPGFAPIVLQYEQARTVLAVPLMREKELAGTIAIWRREVCPFTDKQIELVQNFAAQAVIAIENARLLNELRESLQQQTATADILKVISRSTFELQPVFNSMAESAVKLCEAERAYIFRFDGHMLRAVASCNAGPENQDWVYRNPIPLGRHSISARAGFERRTVQVADIQTDPEYSYVARDVDPIRTTLSVPMLKGDELIGTITIYRLEVKPFTENQIALMETFADQAVIAIENVRLFESVEARTRELAQSLDDLRTAQDRLVQTEKLASLGQLTAGIAHEIKNPLNFINNFSAVSVELIDELREALANANLDDKLRAEIGEMADMLQGNLDKVVQHGRRADSIVKNMLLHSREGSGEHRPVEINALVDESLNLAYHGARAEKGGFNITLERLLDPAAGEVDLFPQEVTRVLLNLISNGFYAATKRKGLANDDGYEPTLTAATKDLGDSVEIRIRDNGTGIPPEVRERMFNPFFTTKPVGEGTGLGLSISHDIIVKQHGGSIEVDTQPGEFTEFRIVLPRGAAAMPNRES